LGGPGSGGGNRRSVEDHRRRATWRRDRHAVKGGLPPPLLTAARQMYTRLKKLGDAYMTKAEKGGKGAAQSLTAAIRCWREAFHIALRVGPMAAPPQRDKLAEHLARRPKVVQLPTAKEGERQ
jgi:hypothetical protein